MNVKLKGVAAACLLATCVSAGVVVPAQAGGIPVIDVANIAEAVKQYQQMVEQLTTLRTQLDQARQQYQALTGGRGMEQLLGNELRNVIPAEWREVMAAAGEISAEADAWKRSMHRIDEQVLSDLLGKMPSNTSQLFNDISNSTASQQVAAGQAYNNASDRFTRLQDLMGAIGTADDLKAINDLTARVGVEQVMLQNEAIKLASMQTAMLAQQQQQKQQMREVLMNKPVQNTSLPMVVR